MDEVIEENNQQKAKGGGAKSFLLNLVRILLLVVILAGLSIYLSNNVISAYKVSGDSMAPTYEDGDYLVTVKTASALSDVKTGDVVVVNLDGKLLVRRVIGVAGDSIDMDANGTVFVNGQYLDESSYAESLSYGKTNVSLPVTVPAGSVFLLGDNREDAIDSRNDALGTVELSKIAGRVLFHISLPAF